jgi:1-acyl-sn-glycerol-3-phosphate acyltransferase
MNMSALASPAIKLLFERVGRPQVHNLPDVLRRGGAGAVIVCNHAGWADSLWVSYAVYPRPLRHMSKRELFSSPIAKWVLEQVGSIPIDRADPSPSSIRSAVDLLRGGELLLIFPAGTRQENALFKRGAATIALHARVPLVPALYDGPRQMQVAHLLGRPRISVTFGAVIATAGLPVDKSTAFGLTERLQAAIENLRSHPQIQLAAA